MGFHSLSEVAAVIVRHPKAFLYACLILLPPLPLPHRQSWSTWSSLGMRDWAALLIASALFAFLSPGLIFQIPGRERPADFMGMKTNIAAVFVHAVIYGLLLILFFIILNVHLYA